MQTLVMWVNGTLVISGKPDAEGNMLSNKDPAAVHIA